MFDKWNTCVQITQACDRLIRQLMGHAGDSCSAVGKIKAPWGMHLCGSLTQREGSRFGSLWHGPSSAVPLFSFGCLCFEAPPVGEVTKINVILASALLWLLTQASFLVRWCYFNV